ncbi:alpha-glucosidase/alpha-galactosidase [Microbacterium sp. JB110]|uniref:alpha-glucosidase/alpha-galactosidase n=1 Tax=Microbacterium sp. JB110 TaxID=2024477 RepID=UPI00097F4D7A|nr:alpha-glucosidase/alpha-galactosidase [Microbacterium sp. JB110]RCS60121.1 alpha-glucosidase/alpha-galactosidase [Microbacterium sp. JB110]SJM47478.1 Alpha-galactosidase [Frigoribacterium sp. JB110]
MVNIAFIGAGSVVFTRQLVTDILRFPELADARFVLHDIDSARLAVAEATASHVSDRLGARAVVVGTTDRRAALDGADFVINMIQVGGIDATLADLEIPARHGLRQTIGDTTGIGGVFRALRTFPVLSDLASDMRDLCPDAWLLNYTNPMAMNVWWLSVTAPDIKVAGLCHSVHWTAHDLAELIDVPFEETRYRAAGVNHQAWLLEWTHHGQDLYPQLRERIRGDDELSRRVRVEMFRRLGRYPTETSEHSAEYLSWFLRSDEQVERFRLQPLEYVDISRENVAEFEATRDALAAGRDLELPDGASEYAPQIIHSLVTGTPSEVHVNVPNRGLIDNLPEDCVVEVPATVDAAGVSPMPMGSLPVQCAAVNQPYVSVGRLTVEAARTGDPTLIRQAVLMDPNAQSTLTPEQIWRLCDELTRAHGQLLPPALRASVPATAL